MNRRFRVFSLALIVVLFAAACGGPTAAPTSLPAEKPAGGGTEAEIAITNFSFEPAQLSVKVGTTVTWTNQDNAPHTVTSTSGDWDSGQLRKGQSFSRTFTQAGVFDYQCTVHPAMKGTVTVTQ